MMFDDNEDSWDEFFFSNDIDEEAFDHDYYDEAVPVKEEVKIPEKTRSVAKQSFADYEIFKHHVTHGTA